MQALCTAHSRVVSHARVPQFDQASRAQSRCAFGDLTHSLVRLSWCVRRQTGGKTGDGEYVKNYVRLRGRQPIRWCSIEVLDDARYSTASDVWACVVRSACAANPPLMPLDALSMAACTSKACQPYFLQHLRCGVANPFTVVTHAVLCNRRCCCASTTPAPAQLHAL